MICGRDPRPRRVDGAQSPFKHLSHVVAAVMRRVRCGTIAVRPSTARAGRRALGLAARPVLNRPGAAQLKALRALDE
eukprot:1886838-Prymnesium_polylepis.1